MSHTCDCGYVIPDNDQASGRYEWAEDGATFAVENISGNVCLEGEQFRGGTTTSNEAVLAREVLRLAEQNSLLLRNLSDMADNRAAEHGLSQQLSLDLEQAESENVQLTNRVNALTARIEEALDLLIHETDSSRRVEQVYRMLEKVMMDGTKE